MAKGAPLLAVRALDFSFSSLYSEKSLRSLVKVAEAPESPMNSISVTIFLILLCLPMTFHYF